MSDRSSWIPMKRYSVVSMASADQTETSTTKAEVEALSPSPTLKSRLPSFLRQTSASSSVAPPESAEASRERERQQRHSELSRKKRASRRNRMHLKFHKVLSETFDESSESEPSTDQEFIISGIRKNNEVDTRRYITNSHFFRNASGFIIVANTVVIALEAAYIQEQLQTFELLEFMFTMFYSIEIGFRMWERGIIEFLTQDDFWWSWFDLVITGLSVTDTAMAWFSGNRGSGASVTRLFRVFRILRMFRAMRFLHEVDYVLAHAALATLKLSCVVLIVLFVASIIATNMLWDCPDGIVAHMFGNLGKSMWTMFKLMTLDDWIPLSERVIKVKPGMLIFFVVFIFSTSIALISLVPAIFIEISLNSKNRQEQIDTERKRLQQRRQKTRLLRTLFKLTDHDDNGKISVGEMKRVLEDDACFKQLEENGLTDAGDLRDIRLGLFDMWESALEDSSKTEAEITEDDFTNGILRVHEDVSQAVIWRCTTATRLMLRDFSKIVQKDLRKIKESAAKWDRNMEAMLRSMNKDESGDSAEDRPVKRTSSSKFNLLGGRGAFDLRLTQSQTKGFDKPGGMEVGPRTSSASSFVPRRESLTSMSSLTELSQGGWESASIGMNSSQASIRNERSQQQAIEKSPNQLMSPASSQPGDEEYSPSSCDRLPGSSMPGGYQVPSIFVHDTSSPDDKFPGIFSANVRSKTPLLEVGVPKASTPEKFKL